MRNIAAFKPAAALLITSLALSGCGMLSVGENPTSVPPGATITAPLATPAEAATAVASPPTPPPADTAAPPIATSAPTADTPIPPTNTPAAPTPTLIPVSFNLIPESGEFEDELPFSTTANDSAVGPNDGDGIQDVTFQFYGPDGQEVYSHTEQNASYCAFGGGDDGQGCNRWLFSEHGNQWPNGKPAQNGPHRVVATIRSQRGGVTTGERNVSLRLNEITGEPTSEPGALSVELIQAGSLFGDELAFQAIARDPAAGADNGAGVDNVLFRIFDSQGQLVHERTERNRLYCAFGGGDDGQNCDIWRFSDNGGLWPGGIPVENGGMYRLEVTATATSGQTSSQVLEFTIQL
jgi:hypothetical protein